MQLLKKCICLIQTLGTIHNGNGICSKTIPQILVEYALPHISTLNAKYCKNSTKLYSEYCTQTTLLSTLKRNRNRKMSLQYYKL